MSPPHSVTTFVSPQALKVEKSGATETRDGQQEQLPTAGPRGFGTLGLVLYKILLQGTKWAPHAPRGGSSGTGGQWHLFV